MASSTRAARPSSGTASPTLAVAVLCHNESRHIRACLDSASFADQLLVLDSGSTDDTVAQARACGAEVWVNPDWQGFAVQRERLLERCVCDYIFYLDADERITPALREELRAVVRSGERAVWQIRWQLVAFGHELRHFQARTRVERLFRRDTLQGWEGVVHEQARLSPPDLPRHLLRAPLMHYVRDSVASGLQKMQQYALLGAEKRVQLGQRGGVVRGVAASVAMFLRMYILRRGVLDGGAGFLYCYLLAQEAFFRYAALHYDREQLTDQVRRG